MNWDMATVIACVAAGGAIGAILRYLVGHYICTSAFPWSTFLVNIIGCTLMAFIAFSFSDQLSKNTVFFLFTGVFGAFTTMSTFTSETAYLFYENEMIKAAWNVALNGGGCLLGAFAGRFFALMV